MLGPKLRHRVRIEMLVTVGRDEVGGVITDWAVYADRVPAEVVPLSGREFIASGAAQAELSARMTIRYDAGVLPNMRVVHEGRMYDLKAVLPDPTNRRHLTLMCATGVNHG